MSEFSLPMTVRARLAAGITAFVAAIGSAEAAPPPGQPDQLDTVIISGAQPAPSLWKVSKGKHVLWVLAAHGPLPVDVTWRKVEARIAESQEVLYPGDGYSYIDVSDLRLFRLGLELSRAGEINYRKPDEKYLPDQETLQDVLPTDTYEKWLDLRRKYIGENDDVDRYRPAVAVRELENAAFGAAYREAFPGSGLRQVGIWDTVELANRHKVRIHQLPDVDRKVKVGDPRNLLTSTGNQALPDVKCFSTGVEQLESRIEWRKAELDAWARGDLEDLRSLHRVRPWGWRSSCFDMQEASRFALDFGALLHEFVDAAKVTELAEEVRRKQEEADVRAHKDWIAAARASIRRNKATFTVASLNEILGPQGFIEKMRALGYSIEDPM